MTDRELHRLAAKAAGLRWEGFADQTSNWAPLHDDGEALWLAVKCGINIFPHRHTQETSTAFTIFTSGIAGLDTWERWVDNEMAATRRAIVRAAAVIGKAMP